MSADYQDPSDLKATSETDDLTTLPFVYTNPLRITIRYLLFHIIFVLFSWSISALVIFYALSPANDNTSGLGIFFTTIFILIALAAAIGATYALFWGFTWSYTFTDSDIIVQHLLHKKRYSASKLENISFNHSLRELRHKGDIKKRYKVWFVTFEFKDKTELKIEGADFGNFIPLPNNDHKPTRQSVELDQKQRQILENLVKLLKPIYLPS